MKIITVIGARPQFIKASVVSQKLRKNNEEIIIHTGQHYDENMSKIFFDELGIPYPNYNLLVGSGGHGKQTGQMLIKLEEIYEKENPDIILVYGDTNSTLAGALVGSKNLIPVVHVEAGLRSFNKAMPEEQNRVVTDHLSKILFAPTESAVMNLKNEGISEGIYNVGDVMFDSVLHFKGVAKEKSNIINRLGIGEEQFVLATIHRAENTNNLQRLKDIIEALSESEKKIVFPLHPRTKKYISNYGLTLGTNIKVINPVGYLDMLLLESSCTRIVTDSGGVQKEAFFLRKPCITIRDETEWIETVENGWNKIVGTNKKKILWEVCNFNPNEMQKEIFGDGKSSQKICDIIESEGFKE